tara:strand:+ start:629 stop:1570 length:942 start_codon:yes stop_codon:yes gene_type:complete
MTKKILLTLIIIIPIGLLAFINTGVEMPNDTEEAVTEVLSSELPKLVKGKTALAKSGDLEIWYETIEPKDSVSGTVLLVMGLASSAMLWTENFYKPFVDAGYRVIRYDNRDVGLSTWIKDYDSDNPYTLENMAQDGISVLDDAGVESAHIVGASMGGMIAQRMAISHSDRVSSLTSIMSSGYMNDPDITPVSKHFGIGFAKLAARHLILGGEAHQLKFFLGTQNALKGNGPYELDSKKSAQLMLYEIQKRSGFNQSAMEQHGAAIESSGSRLGELENIKAPTLVIHGKSDPLVIFDHALKYAPLIPDAETLYI